MFGYMKRMLVGCAILIVVLSLTACSEKKDVEKPAGQANHISTDSFVIALLPEQNVFEQKKRYKPLADYLSRSLGIPVKTKLLDSYDAIYNEMLQKKVNAAFFGSLSYVVMSSKIDIEMLARPYLVNGISTYQGVIFALRDKGITEDVKSWRGKRIALVNKSTTAGYIFPKYYLLNKGIKNFEAHFSRVIYTGSHDASILSVFTGGADIGCASDLIFNKLTRENPAMRQRLIVLANSAQVPANVLGIRKETDSALKERLKDALMNMEKTSEGRYALSNLGAVRFIATKRSEFDPILEMLNALGMKPETFALEAIGREEKPEPSERQTKP
jgi:phosphonate transport system substrate-binding protein